MPNFELPTPGPRGHVKLPHVRCDGRRDDPESPGRVGFLKGPSVVFLMLLEPRRLLRALSRCKPYLKASLPATNRDLISGWL